jgi:hypothetical protein
MQTSPLVQHLIDLNSEPGPGADSGLLTPFGATHSQTRMAAAEAQGFERGRRSVDEGLRQAVADLEAKFAQEREVMRRQWTEAQAQKMQAHLEAGLAKLRLELAQSVAGVIGPFLANRLREEAVEELTTAAEALVNEGMPLTIEVSGPADLTGAIARQLEPLATVVKVALVETPELRVKVDNRMIETRFKDWVSLVEDVLR